MANATDLLTRLAALDPKRARTFDPETGTVRVMRKVYNRRANGQIIGANSGQGSFSWKETRVSVADAVAFAEAQIAEKARVRASVIADTERLISGLGSELAAARAGLEALLASVSLVPAELRACMQGSIDGAEAKVSELEAQISKLQAEMAEL